MNKKIFLLIQLFLTNALFSQTTISQGQGQSQSQGQSQNIILSPSSQEPRVFVEEDNLHKHTKINLDDRSGDIAEAFEKLLYSKAPDERIFVVVDGISYDGVIDVEAMENGTLLLFTIENHSRRCYNKVFKTEEIDEFGIRERRNSHIRVHFPSSTKGKCSIGGSCGCGCEKCSAEIEENQEK